MLTVGALAVVAFFAYQASASDDRPAAAGVQPSPSASPEDGSGGADGGGEGEGDEGPPPVPAESGDGRRVVYSVGQQRVWLVDTTAGGSEEIVQGTYRVFPGGIDPEPGEYAVTSRTAQGTGSDGVAIEHTVIFHTTADGTVHGFSAALDGSTPDPESGQETGAIRQTREDGDAMWLFATAGVAVVVVA
ncbi:hypothetical protein [Streptomyces sp. PT12]|uniref:hypothetical protein n=1 Tax=Streptomyces sp. PT12 TaxID=1510197 RepID=UPI000DE50B17|nr:hypothetical protein [Streptomyces sp. PT12]RBM06991.1 hypothetical protein DEH69_26355 [Streptomyces sp. PT12]